LQIASRTYDTIVVATPVGRIDQAAAAPFEQALAPHLADGAVEALVLDFGGVEYISSIGLRVLMVASKTLRKLKARIAVTAMRPVVAEIFKISRFDAVVEVFPSLRGALGILSPAARDAFDAG
jgi:anti-anti-sigma factor